jgi:hypothetical protein
MLKKFFCRLIVLSLVLSWGGSSLRAEEAPGSAEAVANKAAGGDAGAEDGNGFLGRRRELREKRRANRIERRKKVVGHMKKGHERRKERRQNRRKARKEMRNRLQDQRQEVREELTGQGGEE